jgi:hypothetical protein
MFGASETVSVPASHPFGVQVAVADGGAAVVAWFETAGTYCWRESGYSASARVVTRTSWRSRFSPPMVIAPERSVDCRYPLAVAANRGASAAVAWTRSRHYPSPRTVEVSTRRGVSAPFTRSGPLRCGRLAGAAQVVVAASGTTTVVWISDDERVCASNRWPDHRSFDRSVPVLGQVSGLAVAPGSVANLIGWSQPGLIGAITTGTPSRSSAGPTRIDLRARRGV